MPYYDFKNKETGEIKEIKLSLSEFDQFLVDHPELERYFGDQQLNIGDPVRLGLRKIDGGFKEVLQKIHEKTPGSKMNI